MDPRQLFYDLQVDSSPIRHVDTLSEEHDQRVWRIATAERSYVLKWSPESEAKEVQGYLLLQQLGVPTLPLYGYTSQALLLEDLDYSDRWRLAVEADMDRAEVGQAVARWYQLFHRAGEGFLAKGPCPGFLARETDALDPDGILATGQLLGLPGCSAWGFAAANIQLLKAALGALSLTLNYNDFYWTNLALSRDEESRPEAIVFDYHLLGVGMRFSDCRNVAGSLSGDARRAFCDAYGHVDPREEQLDRPLATLYSLHQAARMPRFPRWAEGEREQVANGELQRELARAVEVARGLEVRV